jgi:hypothetical protein
MRILWQALDLLVQPFVCRNKVKIALQQQSHGAVECFQNYSLAAGFVSLSSMPCIQIAAQ